jgi:uncharacterized membrane protein
MTRTPKKAATFVFALLSILYPCLVYFGLQHWSYRIFGFMIIGVGLGKFWLSHSGDGRGDRVVLAVTLLCGLAIWAFPSELVVKLYPVCISVLVGSLFALSLRQKESLIEKFARLRGAEMTLEAIRYTRNLTAIWAILLYANALVALYLARFGTTEAWTLYCGFLSYLILGGFMGVELLFRQYYMRRHRVHSSNDDHT